MSAVQTIGGPSIERVLAGGRSWTVRVAGDGRPLLLIHGFTGGGATWDGLDLPGVRVIAPDLPGHGGTAAGDDASVEGTAAGLADLLETLGTGPAAVLGYSLGARIALRLAIVRPSIVAGLVLESPTAGIADPGARAARRAADEARATVLDNAGIEAFIATWEREPVLAGEARADAPTRARLAILRRSHDPAGLAASLRQAGQGAMEPLHDRLAEVRAPALVIVGALDPVRTRAEAVAHGIPGAHLAIIPGAAHAPHLETPAVFRNLVLDALREDPAR